jgi:transposase
LQQLIRTVAEADDERLPSDACFACQAIIAQLQAVQIQITRLDKRIHQAHRVNSASKRLEAIPGFGVIVSTAVVATMTDPKAFKTGREFAAWIGLVPRQNSTGGKDRLGSISKQGDRYLRRLLIVGALSVVKSARARPDKYPWIMTLPPLLKVDRTCHRPTVTAHVDPTRSSANQFCCDAQGVLVPPMW